MTATKKGTILVVEDNADTSSFIATFLGNEGYEIYTATNRDRALEVLRQTKVDLIFLDYWMQGMTASQFLHRLKNIHPNTQIVLMTAQPQIEAISMALGVNNLLPKPFDEKAILEALKSTVS